VDEFGAGDEGPDGDEAVESIGRGRTVVAVVEDEEVAVEADNQQGVVAPRGIAANAE